MRHDELRRVAGLHPAVEHDARVDRPVVRLEEADDRVAAGLLLAVADDPERDRRRPLREELLDRLQLHPELSLVVCDAACVEPFPSYLRRERVALPQLERRGRLDVVVAVDEDGGRPGRADDLADDEPSVLAQLRLAAERSHLRSHPLAGPGDVVRVRGIGTHTRNREERAELFEPVRRRRRCHNSIVRRGRTGYRETARTPVRHA